VSLGNMVESCGLDACGSEYRQVAGSCECDSEPLDSINGREFPE